MTSRDDRHPAKLEHVLSSAPARRLLGGRAGVLFTIAGLTLPRGWRAAQDMLGS